MTLARPAAPAAAALLAPHGPAVGDQTEPVDRRGTFQVWHTRDLLPCPLAPAEARRLWRIARARWVHVADVQARSWEDAFDLTNTYDEQVWYTRAAVTLRIDPDDPGWALAGLHPLHSTAVGDVLVAGDWVKMVWASGWLEL